ncbi:hypothetical protein WN48_10284 [Eufriesea mexicana]|uniref:Uncharacterized protein n=1 Tax=Eufriesea mexicana TaxID=516756 RepID=A0A310S6L7_9HYME|nr:hypothetical protein WN48_10284 [Eufriesea mexicana]
MQSSKVTNEDRNNVSKETETDMINVLINRLNEKQQLKDALVYAENRLREKNLIASEAFSAIFDAAMAMGEKIIENIVNMLDEDRLVTEECLISNDDSDKENMYENVTHEDSLENNWTLKNRISGEPSNAKPGPQEEPSNTSEALSQNPDVPTPSNTSRNLVSIGPAINPLKTRRRLTRS